MYVQVPNVVQVVYAYLIRTHTKRPRRHNFWSLTTSLSLAEGDGEGALAEWAVYLVALLPPPPVADRWYVYICH